MLSPDSQINPTDTRSIILQVTKHIQNACPDLSLATVQRMATGFEEHVRFRSTSRQDYVDRCNAGVKTILENAKNGSFPNSMPLPHPARPQGSSNINSATLQSRTEAPSERPQRAYHTRPVTAEHTPTPRSASHTAAGLSASDLHALVTSADSFANTPAPTSGLLQPPLATSTQIPQVSQSLPASAQKNDSATPRKDSLQAPMGTGSKCPAQVSKKLQDEKLSGKATRRTRGRPSRTRSTPSTNGKTPTPPTTRSKAKRTTKRAPRKKQTKSRKPPLKDFDNTEQTTGGESHKSSSQGNPANVSERTESQGTARPPKKVDAVDAREIRHSDNVFADAQEQMNRKYAIAQEHNQQSNFETPRSSLGSSSMGSQAHPSGNFGLNCHASGIGTPQATKHNQTPVNGPQYSFGEASRAAPPPVTSMQTPFETIARPSSSHPTVNGSHLPSHSGISTQNVQGAGENVRLCSNGHLEIDDGIRVPQNHIINAASSIGITLTSVQLLSLKKSQALEILVKASQYSLLRENGVMGMSSPMSPQNTQQRAREQSFPPQMPGNFQSYLHLQTSRQGMDASSPQASIHTGRSLSPTNQGGSQERTPMTATPERTPQPSAQKPTQRASPLGRFAPNVPEVQARLRKFQMDFKMCVPLLQGQLSGIRVRSSDICARYLSCCINLLLMDASQVRGVSVDVINSVEVFLRMFLRQHSGPAAREIPVQGVPGNVHPEGRGGRVPMSSLHTSEIDGSEFQTAPRSMPNVAANPLSTNPTARGGFVSSEMFGNEYATGAVGTTNHQPIPGTQQRNDIATNTVNQTDHMTSSYPQVPIPAEPNTRKRKSFTNHELEKNGKRVATSSRSVAQNHGADEEIACSRHGNRAGEVEDSTKVAPVDLIDITDEKLPPFSVAACCRRDKNGNMFNLVKLSDRPNFEEVLRRLRFMLNCAMKLTTCYISITEGKEEDNTRRLEEVVVYLQPKTQVPNPNSEEDEEEPEVTSLPLVDLINAECVEARKRYGSLTVQVIEEFGRPVFRGILRYNDRPYPKLEFRVAGNRKGEPEVRGYERPPMGWVGVLEQVKELFCSTLEGGKGMEAMIRGWIRNKDEFKGRLELHELSEDESKSA